MTEFKWTLLGAVSFLHHQEMPLRPGVECQMTFLSTAGEVTVPIPKERMAELRKAMSEVEAEGAPIFELELVLRKYQSGIPNTDDHPLHCTCRRCESG